MTKTNDELLDLYLTTQIKSVKSRIVYKSELNKLNEFFSKKPFAEIDKWQMLEYSKFVATNSKSERTEQRIYSMVRSFYKWLVTMGVVGQFDNPTAVFKKLTPGKDNAKYKQLDEKEVTAIAEAARPNARNYALVVMLAVTGKRINEVIALNWNDIFYNEECKAYYAKMLLKGRKEQIVYLRKDVFAALMRLRRDEPLDAADNSPVFTTKHRGQIRRMTTENARCILEALAKKVGIDKPVTPHWFRHTFMTKTHKNGGSLKNLQGQAGHSDIRTTMRYTHEDMDNRVSELYPIWFK